MNPDVGALSESKRVSLNTITKFPTPAHLPESKVERFFLENFLVFCT